MGNVKSGYKVIPTILDWNIASHVGQVSVGPLREFNSNSGLITVKLTG
jgi:hypothetical protein